MHFEWGHNVPLQDTGYFFITLKVLWHSLQASPSSGKQILTADWLFFLSLWQSTWQQQLNGGKIYFGCGFHHDKNHRENQACPAEPSVEEVWENNLLHCVRAGSRESRTGNTASLESKRHFRMTHLWEPKLHCKFQLLYLRDPLNKNAPDLQAPCPRTIVPEMLDAIVYGG